MGTESEDQKQEDSVLVPNSSEDQFDVPRTYVPLAAPWYTDLTSVLMFGFLSSVLVAGSISLTLLAFTKNPWEIFGITFGFVGLTLIGIFLKVRLSKYS